MKDLRSILFVSTTLVILLGGLFNCSSFEDEINGTWVTLYPNSDKLNTEFRFYSSLNKGEEFTYFNDEPNSLECQLKFNFAIVERDADTYTLSRTFTEDNYCIDFFSKDIEIQPANVTETVDIGFDEDRLQIGGNLFQRDE